MMCTPDYIMDFGEHQSYSLREIYHYDPTYFNWLIEYKDWFEIDVEEFYKLGKPVKYNNPITIKLNGEDFRPPNKVSTLGNIKYLKTIDLKFMKPYDFKFSDRLIEILKLKKEGKYVAPPYDYVKHKYS